MNPFENSNSQQQRIAVKINTRLFSCKTLFALLASFSIWICLVPSQVRGDGILHFGELSIGTVEEIRQKCDPELPKSLFGFSGEYNIIFRLEDVCQSRKATSSCTTYAYNIKRGSCKLLGISEGNGVQDLSFVEELRLTDRQVNRLGLIPFVLRLDGEERILMDTRRGILLDNLK